MQFKALAVAIKMVLTAQTQGIDLDRILAMQQTAS